MRHGMVSSHNVRKLISQARFFTPVLCLFAPVTSQVLIFDPHSYSWVRIRTQPK